MLFALRPYFARRNGLAFFNGVLGIHFQDQALPRYRRKPTWRHRLRLPRPQRAKKTCSKSAFQTARGDGAQGPLGGCVLKPNHPWQSCAISHPSVVSNRLYLGDVSWPVSCGQTWLRCLLVSVSVAVERVFHRCEPVRHSALPLVGRCGAGLPIAVGVPQAQ